MTAAQYGWKWFAVFAFATAPMGIGAVVMTGTAWGFAPFLALSALAGWDSYRSCGYRP